ncbi:MAG: hypothetical protein ACLFQJ_02970 [Campylobacterales bacterium]
MKKYKEKAKKVLSKSPHYAFFKNNLYDFQAINNYKGFAHLDDYYTSDYDSINKSSFNLSYVGWFVCICVLEAYGDDFCEFENDLDEFIYQYEYIKQRNLSKVFCEIKEILLAYKILCNDSDEKSTVWYDRVPNSLIFSG